MATSATPTQFPGRVISAGSDQRQAVLAIQQRLNALGCGPVDVDGAFGPQVIAAVELFQTRFGDPSGRALDIDGRVGPNTWAALFGQSTVPVQASVDSDLLKGVIDVAVSQIGIMENPLGSNRGPEVDDYLRRVGVNPASGSFAWCAAFVYFCFDEACKAMTPPTTNPAVKTAGVLDHWVAADKVARAKRISASEAQETPSLVKPGMAFFIRTSDVHGHCGMVEKVQGGNLTTIEGNTNPGGSREGIGVFRREARTILNINLGYVLYS